MPGEPQGCAFWPFHLKTFPSCLCAHPCAILQASPPIPGGSLSLLFICNTSAVRNVLWEITNEWHWKESLLCNWTYNVHPEPAAHQWHYPSQLWLWHRRGTPQSAMYIQAMSSQIVPLLCRALNPPLPSGAHLINTFSLWMNDSSETYSTQNNYKQLFNFYERRMRRNCVARIAESKKLFIHVLINKKWWWTEIWSLLPPMSTGAWPGTLWLEKTFALNPQNFKQRTIWMTVAVS